MRLVIAAVVLLASPAQDPSDAPARCEALFANLASLDPLEREVARAELLKVAEAERVELRQAAGDPAARVALAFLGDAAAGEGLAELLGDARFMLPVAEALGSVGAEKAVEPLFGLLDGDHLGLGMARALAKVKSAVVDTCFALLFLRRAYVAVATER
jgi:hypothetical protein